MTAVADAATEPEVAPLLEARQVRVRFGGVLALDDVTIAVPPRSLIGLVGPNGAGKSTLFGVCSGLIRPNAGQVVFGGRDVTRASPQSRARLGLARTFQQPELFRGLTVREHMTIAYRASKSRTRLWSDMFTAASLRKPPAEEADRIGSLLELLSLDRLADTIVDALPLGATRLVEVARALASGPSVVLLDEPLSGLDSQEAAALAGALARTVSEEGISLLLVEHDVDMVLRHCGHIFVLEFGAIIAQGDAMAIRSDRKVKAAYLGDDPVVETAPPVVETAPPVVETAPPAADNPA